MTHPTLTRAHLEALLIAHALITPAYDDFIDETRLSPAANALLAFVVGENAAARVSLKLAVRDEYQARLAERVERLTLEQLLYFPPDAVVAHVNALPIIGAAAATSRAA